MKHLGYVSALALFLAACSNGEEATQSAAEEAESAAMDMADTSMGESAPAEEAAAASPTLAEVIAHERRDERRARDEWRNPEATLAFFGLEPDMTVMEVLPGNGGWYTQILTPFTAAEGRMIGVTYPESLWLQMFPAYGPDNYERFGTDLSQMSRYLSVEGVETAEEAVGYAIDAIPESENGEVDAALFFRALHHLFRFEEPMIDTALAEVYDALAPGGIAGVVQHRAPEDADVAFANGDNGYLRQSDVIAAFERAGFVLEATSEINANPNDPADGIVWRLPPTTTDNPETAAIGESDRMTLLFRKPE